MVYNVSSSGITGITNFASQTGSLGTIFGMALVLGVMLGAVGFTHSWNTKGWLYKLVNWLLKNVGENILYGCGTLFVLGSIYFIGTELSKFGESNPNLLYDVGYFIFKSVLVVGIVALIGYIAKPFWNYIIAYAYGRKQKRVV